MSFGYERQPQGMLGDSIVLTAHLYSNDNETLIPLASIHGVTFTIVKPGGNPASPDIVGATGTIPADGEGQYVVAGSVNDTEGQYHAIAIFSYDDPTLSLTGLTKSIPVDYTINDPFVRTGPSPSDTAVNMCWTMLEDCFDSEQGGPWLRDMTLAVFDQTKLRALVPQVIMDINLQMPFTSFTEASFPYAAGDGDALVAQGLLVATIRHLMRSYTEQPDVTSSPVAFFDRKRYQQAWSAIYTIELDRWKLWLNRWKLQSYDLSSAALLLGTKAGRMLPAPMRSRNVGRGF